MKRVFSICLLIVMIAALILGCSKQVPEETNPHRNPETEPIETMEPTFPANEDIFYFSNESEYSRLYSQRLDGSDLKLVVDTYCYDVQRIGDTVYYLDGQNLCTYHITTDQTSVLVSGVYDYEVEDNHLVYYLDRDEAYQTEVRYRNLETSEERSLDLIMSGGECDISAGILYYNKYDQMYGRGILCACDLESFEIKAIAGELDSFHRLRSVPGGVYFEGYKEGENFAMYYASADGAILRKAEGGLTENCQMFHQDDAGILCVFSEYMENGVKTAIHRHNPNGTVTDILRGEDEGYFTVNPIKDGLWLVSSTSYDSWIPVDAQENESYFVYHVEYMLLDKEGTVTPIDTAGELGKMFVAGDFPVIDSSTARKPVTADLYSLFVANFGYEGTKPICSTTHGAWLNIADRKADIALLAAPTKEEMDYLNQRGVSIEMKLYGGDGLVFIGNSQNPVQSLTHEQIIGIYQGKIKKWSEVGGPDVPITVYYRDDQSGSQRLFEKMVFKGLELPNYEDLGFWYMDEMSTIVDIVMDDPYAIGYSIMTYLDDVYNNEALKIFAVDGVVPSVDTVKDSSYPYHTQGFVVIRSDEPADSPARRLYNWFGTPISDEILIANGITPLHAEGIG